jgi:hypothetical protein
MCACMYVLYACIDAGSYATVSMYVCMYACLDAGSCTTVSMYVCLYLNNGGAGGSGMVIIRYSLLDSSIQTADRSPLSDGAERE